MAKRKRIRVRGATRMKALGCKCVQVWLDPTEHNLIRQAADEQNRKPLATFVRDAALIAATKIVTAIPPPPPPAALVPVKKGNRGPKKVA